LASDLAELARIQRLDRGERSDRHERRRVDGAVRGDENAGARGAGGSSDGEVECRSGHGVVFSSSVATDPLCPQEYPAVIGARSPSWLLSKRSWAASPPNSASSRSSPLDRVRIASRTAPPAPRTTVNPASPSAAWP